MFKRLFLLSGVLAFILAALTMWFWYIPNHQNELNSVEELNQELTDTVSLEEPTDIPE